MGNLIGDLPPLGVVLCRPEAMVGLDDMHIKAGRGPGKLERGESPHGSNPREEIVRRKLS
jgi:hypothetical protein